MSLAENLALLAKFLTGDSSGNLTGTNTPPLDDSSKKLATTDFLTQQWTGTGKQSLSNPGYQKIPGGLVLMWGYQNNIPSGTQTTINLPITVTTLLAAIPTTNTNTGAGVSVLNYTGTSFQVVHAAGYALTVFWMAIAKV